MGQENCADSVARELIELRRRRADLVSRDGAPVDVSLARSSGHASLDTAAIAAVWRWRFVPATRDGEAIVSRGELVEIGPTGQMFTAPKSRRTDDYVTGRFG